MAKDTYIPRDEVIDMNKEFNKVRKKAEKELMQLPGVVAVGVGLKEVKGKIQRQPCFKITVKKKKEQSTLKSKEIIPDTIYGFKTDVNEIGTGKETRDDNGYRPLMGGSNIEVSSKSGYGTLGCFARRNSDSKIVLLSNWHIIVGDPDTIDGDRIGQPTHNGCCSCCACNEIAVTVDGRFKTGNMDAAIALLNGQESDTIPDEKYLNEILQIGYVAGSAAPVAMETVYKYGARTDLTKGQIANDNFNTTVEYSSYSPAVTVSRTSQLEISPLAPYTKFSDKGDSGSVILNEKQEVVGLNYGGSNTTPNGFATPITTILATLGITILDSTFHESVSGKEGTLLNSIVAPPSTFSNMANAFAEVEAELSQFPEGKRMLELFKLHRTELLDLVNHNREVMAAWNRYQGPAYLAHIARSIRRVNKPVPEQIKGITMQNLILKMTAVLQRNGSPELARSVNDNYLQILNVLSSGRSPEDWKDYLTQIDQFTYN